MHSSSTSSVQLLKYPRKYLYPLSARGTFGVWHLRRYVTEGRGGGYLAPMHTQRSDEEVENLSKCWLGCLLLLSKCGWTQLLSPCVMPCVEDMQWISGTYYPLFSPSRFQSYHRKEYKQSPAVLLLFT
jgi:hypothetical protein